jgi:hypothetical protein
MDCHLQSYKEPAVNIVRFGVEKIKKNYLLPINNVTAIAGVCNVGLIWERCSLFSIVAPVFTASGSRSICEIT